MNTIWTRWMLIIFALLFSYICAHGSVLRFEQFSNKTGFNQNTINTITKDRYGYLWFGTPNGLIRYDGYEFINYSYELSSENVFQSDCINSVFSDDNGCLWIGTNEGVVVYIPWREEFNKVNMPDDIKVSQIKGDELGRVWISGQNELYMCSLDTSKGRLQQYISDNFIKKKSNLSSITDFQFVDDTKIILATLSGLKKIEFSSFSSEKPVANTLKFYQTLDTHVIYAVAKIKNIFWIGTRDGLFKATVEGERIHIIQSYFHDKTNGQYSISSIYEDKQGNLWLGTQDNGILRYVLSDDAFEQFNYDPKEEASVSSKRINCFYEDDYNVLWIGTAQGGIDKLDLMQKPFVNYAHNPYDKYSLSDNLITAILEDKDGYLWIAGYNSGVCRSLKPVDEHNLGDLRFENISDKFSMLDKDVVHSIYQDSLGYIWFGTNYAVFVYSPDTKTVKKVSFDLENQAESALRIRVIRQLDDENMLFGGNTIVKVKKPWSELEEKKVTLSNSKLFKLFSGEFLQAMHLDKNGSIWFGTNRNLFCGSFNNDSLLFEKVIISDSSKPEGEINNVFSITQDNDCNLLVGTFGKGLKKIFIDKTGKAIDIKHYKKNHLLPDNAVYGIVIDEQQNLWISTDMGLCRIYENLTQSDVFNVRDGLPNNNFRQGAYFKGKKGILYFGGLNGLSMFQPSQIQLNIIPPKVMIAALSVNNKLMKAGEMQNGQTYLTRSITETEHVTFSYKDQIIAFDIIVQHSATPFNNRLEYKLEGFNEDWISGEFGKTTITYTNLPAGDYVLRIKGENGDGVVSEASTDLRITVLPPWYKTWWFYTVLIVVFIALIIGVFWYFVKLASLKQSLKFEKIDKMRIDSVNESKLLFFTNISHEFRTPLTLIAGPLERVMSTNLDSESQKYLTIIKNNTKRLLLLVDQLITFRRADQGYMDISHNETSLGNFIYPITEAFEEYAIRKNINFFYKVNSPNEMVIIDVEKMERIIFNLLSNALKFTAESGSVSLEAEVNIRELKGELIIRIIDNGIGIPKDKLDKVFERFYKLEGQDENIGGTGIGLAFCKSLIDILGGEIKVESEMNVRTCFTVSVPFENVNNLTNKADQKRKTLVKDWIPMPVKSDDLSDDPVYTDYKKQFRILVVEDEVEVREFLFDSLSDMYSVSFSTNGQEGLSMVHEKMPDLIISDVMMPVMNGFELCQAIKSNPDTCHIPVILLTALGDNDKLIQGLEYGADDYIQKPFSLRHLMVRVEQLIENNKRLKDYFVKHSTLPSANIDISARDRDFLSKILDSIEKNLSDSQFGVEELASDIGLSTSQFYRRLKQLTGQIPNVYLRNYRLQRAAQLLKENTMLSVAEVMYEVGFESNSYFSTAFKKLHGYSPSDFLKKG